MRSNLKRTGALWLAALMVVSGFAVVNPAGAQTDRGDSQAPGDDWVQTRLQMTHRPNWEPGENSEASNVNEGYPAGQNGWIGDRGIYVNEIPGDDRKDSEARASLRLYGQPGKIAPRTYSNPGDAFDPTVIPKDSVTFNPALINHTADDDPFVDEPEEGPNPIGIRTCGEDAHLKKDLRVWYEPGHEFHGPRVNSGAYDATVADVIQVESTYSFLDASSYRPTTGCASMTDFPFPTEGVYQGEDSDHKQPGLDTMRMVHVESVSEGDSVQGTVELSREVTLEEYDSVEFLDHYLKFKNLVTDLDGAEHARVTVKYAGNTFKDAARQVDLRERVCFDRSNSMFSDISHSTPNIRTWCAQLISFDRNPDEDERDTVTIKVSKELSAGDVFYADGVRYEIPAVHTVDGELKYITLRTPIPKSDPSGSWTSATDETRDEEVDGQFQLQDNSWVTTQWLHQVDWNDPIPVDPPFNHEEGYLQVDDTDVQIWEQGEDNEEKNFPYGPPDDPVTDGGDGMPMFPEGERYLTQQEPPQEWVDFFDAEKTGFEESLEDGSQYADNIPERFSWEEGINDDAWRNSRETGPPGTVRSETDFFWNFEWYEERYTSNLLEILERNFTTEEQSFTKYDIASHPDQYTQFVLPDRNNPASFLDYTAQNQDGQARIHFSGDCTRDDLVSQDRTPACSEGYHLLGGDYLATTSLTLQDGETRHQFTHDPRVTRELVNNNGDDPRYLHNDGLDAVDLYFNEVDIPGLFGGDREDVADTTARLYGEEGDANHAPDTYDEYWMALDPYAIPKDSATFNPALMTNPAEDFDLKACGENVHQKKHLRTWYEPGHDYHGPRTTDSGGSYDATVGDVIQVESTYMLLDASNYLPVDACEDTTRMNFPTTGVHLQEDDGHEQPGLDTLELVNLGNISDIDEDRNGTDGIVEIETNMTLEIGEMRQFLDHSVRFDGIIEEPVDSTTVQRADLQFKYLGNTFADAPQSHNVGDRIYLSRSNDAFETPNHDNGNQLRTWYVEVDSFDRNPDSEENDTVSLTVGKELQQGDVFYVDGVRYEVPSIHVVPCGDTDTCMKQITLRTPLPKSDPEGSWTSVTDPTREEEIDGQWQVQDNSWVTTQWLIEIDWSDPIPVDPPFNHENYTMVDDTDVQLWEQGEDNEEENFPWGEANESLPDGNGLPMWSQGERFLTDQEPPQAWIDHFDAEPTGFKDVHEDDGTLADSLPDRTATAEGINHNAWNNTTLEGPQSFNEENVTFFWIKEWYEGRYSTNLLERPVNDTYVKDEIQTRPDRYTEFVLPDRPNPASLTKGTLEFGDDPDCTRGDLFPNDVGSNECEETYDLLGGDYLITTSFLLEWCGCEDPLDRGGDTGDAGDGDSGSGDVGSQNTHAYDANGDCVFSDDEVLALVSDWGNDQASDDLLLSGVSAWGQAPNTYC